MKLSTVILLSLVALLGVTVLVLHDVSASNVLANPAGFIITNSGGSTLATTNTTPNSPTPTGQRVNWANNNPTFCPTIDNGTGSGDYCELDDTNPPGFNSQSCPSTFGVTRGSFTVPTITIPLAASYNVSSFSTALGYHFPNNVGQTGICIGIWGLQTGSLNYVAMGTTNTGSTRDTNVALVSGNFGTGFTINQIVLTPGLNAGGGGFAFWQMHYFDVEGFISGDAAASQDVGFNGTITGLGNTTTQNSSELPPELPLGVPCNNPVSGCQLTSWNGVPLVMAVSTVDANGILDAKADPGNATLFKIQLPSCTVANCSAPIVIGNSLTADVENDTFSSPHVVESFKSGANAGVGACSTFNKACRAFSVGFSVNFSSSPPKTLVGFYCEDPTHFPCFATSNDTTSGLFNVTNGSVVLDNLTITGNNSNAKCVNKSCQVSIALLNPIYPIITSATPSDGAITLGWSQAYNALRYNVYESATFAQGTLPMNGSTYSYVGTAPCCGAIVTGLTNGNTYHFRVVSVGASELAVSNDATGVPAAVSGDPRVTLGVLSLRTQATLTWSTTLTNPLGFKVYKGLTVPTVAFYANASASPFVDNETPATCFYYGVLAFNATTATNLSNIVQACYSPNAPPVSGDQGQIWGAHTDQNGTIIGGRQALANATGFTYYGIGFFYAIVLLIFFSAGVAGIFGKLGWGPKTGGIVGGSLSLLVSISLDLIPLWGLVWVAVVAAGGWALVLYIRGRN